MIFFALSLSPLLLAVSAEMGPKSGFGSVLEQLSGTSIDLSNVNLITLPASGNGSMYDGSSMKPGEIFNETWGDFNETWGDFNGTWGGWPEEMHCCKYKMVGDYKYYLVNYPEAEDMRKQGMMLPWKCYNDCIY